MSNNSTMTFDFKSWILSHDSKEYNIVLENEHLIKLQTDYGEASIAFTEINESIVVEFTIISRKDESVKFYLHFELNDEDHAKQLYDEMIETLIGLKDEKTLQVLLSCSSGLTTAMFAENLNSMVEMLGLDMHFEAVPYTNIYEEVDKYDVVLLAPQIGYMLKRLKESLNEKLVLQIPTAIFASYDALSAVQFIQSELESFYDEKNKKEIEKKSHCIQYERRILSIVVLIDKAQTRIYYRLNDRCEVIDQNLIIKPSLNIYDLYDIIDTVILKHSYIDVIGIATPGIVQDNKQLISPNDYRIIDIKKDFEDKYGIEVFAYNNANAAAVGFSLEHPEYKNIIFHSQPFGFGVGGQGIISNGKIIIGKNGISGELRYFINRMQFSDDCHKLAWSEQGVVEIVTKSLLPAICMIGPEAIAICSPMSSDMNEIKNKISSFIPEEFLPEFYYVKKSNSYMLDGITKLCVDNLSES